MREAVSKTNHEKFFEDLPVGETIEHATPRTITEGDVALYRALCGARFVLQASDEFARKVGLPCAPVDDLLTFNAVLGMSEPDFPDNGSAELAVNHVCFGATVYPGDTLAAVSTVTGTALGPADNFGTVHIDTEGVNQDGEAVVRFSRQLLVARREPARPGNEEGQPGVPSRVDAGQMSLPYGLRVKEWSYSQAGAPHRWGDYEPGETIDHVHGAAVDGPASRLAGRLLGNLRPRCEGAHAIPGGYVLSLARSLSYHGLENTLAVLAINDAKYLSGVRDGDTLYASTKVLERFTLPDIEKVAALRLCTTGMNCAPSVCAATGDDKGDDKGEAGPGVVLKIDYVAAVPV